MSEELIGVEDRGDGIVVLRLQRERKLNAISGEMEAQLAAAIASPTVRDCAVVVLTGGERAFSAGADVTEFRERTPEAVLAYYRRTGGVYEAFSALPQPTIAAISGYCLGGGLELALTADFRLATAGATFGLPEVGLGIIPSSGGTARLVRIVGPARAKELILRGQRFDAARAASLGVITEVVEGDVLEAALALAGELAALPSVALQVTKQAIDAAAESSHAASILVERLAYGLLAQTAEAQAAADDFGSGR
jgi:enoyl-CoA hydratase/carnithine racemase